MGSGSLGLLSSDVLDIDAPISVTGAGSANLSYDAISPANLSFGLTGAGFLGSLTFALRLRVRISTSTALPSP